MNVIECQEPCNNDAHVTQRQLRVLIVCVSVIAAC